VSAEFELNKNLASLRKGFTNLREARVSGMPPEEKTAVPGQRMAKEFIKDLLDYGEDEVRFELNTNARNKVYEYLKKMRAFLNTL